MRAMLCPGYGTPEALTLRDVPEPAPAPGEVLVGVAAAGVGFPDLLSISGDYPIRSIPPFIPGVEGAGTVVRCGSGVARFAPGDRVCWQDNVRKGSFAERIALPAAGLARVPAQVDLVTAACLPMAYGTARFSLEHRARVVPGEVLVVHGAAGGVGFAAIQLGRAMGARVIATSGSATKREWLRAKGVDHVLDAGDPGLREAVLDLIGGRGADVVLDPVGGPLFDQSLRFLVPYGRLLVVGFTSGIFPVARANILLIKALSVIGVNYGLFLAEEPAAAAAALEAILAEVVNGAIAPPIEAVLPLPAAAEALERLRRREATGKIALTVQGGG